MAGKLVGSARVGEPCAVGRKTCEARHEAVIEHQQLLRRNRGVFSGGGSAYRVGHVAQERAPVEAGGEAGTALGQERKREDEALLAPIESRVDRHCAPLVVAPNPVGKRMKQVIARPNGERAPLRLGPLPRDDHRIFHADRLAKTTLRAELVKRFHAAAWRLLRRPASSLLLLLSRPLLLLRPVALDLVAPTELLCGPDNGIPARTEARRAEDAGRERLRAEAHSRAFAPHLSHEASVGLEQPELKGKPRVACAALEARGCRRGIGVEAGRERGRRGVSREQRGVKRERGGLRGSIGLTKRGVGPVDAHGGHALPAAHLRRRPPPRERGRRLVAKRKRSRRRHQYTQAEHPRRV
eukprot:scaffold271437_cov27-Tisochrysis_lutea.AAC.1